MSTRLPSADCIECATAAATPTMAASAKMVIAAAAAASAPSRQGGLEASGSARRRLCGGHVYAALTCGLDRGEPKVRGPGLDLLVAIGAFHPLVPFLRLDRQGGDRAGLEPADAD